MPTPSIGTTTGARRFRFLVNSAVLAGFPLLGGPSARAVDPPFLNPLDPAPILSESEEDPYRSSWIGGGAPFSTKETSLGVGALVLYSWFLAETPDTRPSSVAVRAAYTVRNQFVGTVEPRIFFPRSTFALIGLYEYRFFPNRYYGLGNDAPSTIQDYTEDRFTAETELQYQLITNLFLGFRHELDQLDVIRVGDSSDFPETEGIDYLDSGLVPGGDGVLLNGLGLTMTWDSRNSEFSATQGEFGRVEYQRFPEKLGGADVSFDSVSFDARRYFETFSPRIPWWDDRRPQVLAFQVYGEYVFGDAPFQALPRLGGPRRMRGYFRGRYRDNYLTTAQVEYRMPLFWRINAAAFAGVANVAGPNGDGGPGRFTYVLGAGLRGLVDVKKRTMVRLDFGFSDEGDIAIILGRSEAF